MEITIELAPDDPEPFYNKATAEEWCQSFREWAASHTPHANPVDDSRESIYEGRGE